MAKGKKHSLVQCRIEACQKVDEIVKEKDCSIRDAMRELAGSQGVPFGTLKYWYYRDDESNKSGGKVQPPEVPKSTAKVKAKVINKIVDNIAKARIKDEEDVLAAQANRDGAHTLANDLGSAVLAEELYEMFLKAISKVDQLIKTNNELNDPVDSDKLVTTLLRMARNAGWKEPEPKLVKYCSNRTCDNFMSKEDREKAIAAAKKKAKDNK